MDYQVRPEVDYSQARNVLPALYASNIEHSFDLIRKIHFSPAISVVPSNMARMPPPFVEPMQLTTPELTIEKPTKLSDLNNTSEITAMSVSSASLSDASVSVFNESIQLDQTTTINDGDLILTVDASPQQTPIMSPKHVHLRVGPDTPIQKEISIQTKGNALHADTNMNTSSISNDSLLTTAATVPVRNASTETIMQREISVQTSTQKEMSVQTKADTLAADNTISRVVAQAPPVHAMHASSDIKTASDIGINTNSAWVDASSQVDSEDVSHDMATETIATTEVDEHVCSVTKHVQDHVTQVSLRSEAPRDFLNQESLNRSFTSSFSQQIRMVSCQSSQTLGLQSQTTQTITESPRKSILDPRSLSKLPRRKPSRLPPAS